MNGEIIQEKDYVGKVKSKPATALRNKFLKQAFWLSVLTIGYNLAEGVVATYFGIKDETLTLFGFGADSFIETISALGIAHMIYRMQRQPASDRGPFEILALRITGWCFYALALILLISSAISIAEGHQPSSAMAGIIIAAISVLTMWALVAAKLYLGRKLNSAPIIADAKCNTVCIYMSLVLLLSSVLWGYFELPYVDVAGSLALVYFSLREGREAFGKARGISCCSC